jgi:ABC-type tungstate transport system permease subunit
MPNETEKSKVKIMVDMLKPILDYCDENKIQIAVVAGDTEDLFSATNGNVDFLSTLIEMTPDKNIKDIANVATAKMMYGKFLLEQEIANTPNPETEN